MTTPPPRADQRARLGDDLDPANPVQVFTGDGVEHHIVTAESNATGAVGCVEPTPQTHQEATLTSRVLGNTLTTVIRRWLGRYSVALLRISMGAVIYGQRICITPSEVYPLSP